jgi:transcriptional regulator
MLILRTLARNGALHGYGIAQFILQTSNNVLQVEEGSLYPALQRLLVRGWVAAEWRTTDTGRRARFYTLTPAGRQQLDSEVREFSRVMQAIQLVLE